MKVLKELSQRQLNQDAVSIFLGDKDVGKARILRWICDGVEPEDKNSKKWDFSDLTDPETSRGETESGRYVVAICSITSLCPRSPRCTR